MANPPDLVLRFSADQDGDDSESHVVAGDALARLGPLHNDPELDELQPRRVRVDSLQNARLGPVLGAIRHGARDFELVDFTGNLLEAGAWQAVALTVARELRRRLGRLPVLPELCERAGVRVDPPWATAATTDAACRAILEDVRGVKSASLPAASLRIAHYLGDLGAGGAERQLTLLAAGQRQRGHRVRVLTGYPLDGAGGHFAAELGRGGVPVRHLPPHSRWKVLPQLRNRDGHRLPRRLVQAVDRHHAAEWIVALVAELATDPPDVLHCWLDESNLIGALAGLLSGVPRVVLSTRNVNPSRFPRFCRPWFQPTYRAGARCLRLRFVANSRAGAEDYARWADMSPGRFTVIPNAVDARACRPPTPSERAAARRGLGLDPQAFVVAGMFRIAPEKRPLDFLEVVAAARAQVPGLIALQLGTGRDPAVDRAVARLKLEETVRFLGRLPDPWPVLGAADVALLTSEAEGFPNAALEAQALGVPVVLTRAGGSAEAVRDGQTGHLRDVGDIAGLADALVTLARDPEGRRRMGAAGRAWVEAELGVSSLVQRTLDAYR